MVLSGLIKRCPGTSNPSNGISPGSYDFVGAALHEITEAVGRQILPTSLDLLNLFHYAAPGQFGTGLQQDYFSIDGGKTNLDFFAFPFGDKGDWAVHTPPDANDASQGTGQVLQFSLTDLVEMDVIGFNLNWGAPGLPLADNVALPATDHLSKNVQCVSSELWVLKNFDAAQSLYGQSIGLDAVVYMYSALGQALADGSDTGSTAFKSTWGPLTISSDATFVTHAYTNVFAASGTAAQIQHFVDQLNSYKSIYTASGAFGTNANEIDLLARGAIYGQMIEVKAETPTAVTAAASAPADTSLVGISGQHDTTQPFQLTSSCCVFAILAPA